MANLAKLYSDACGRRGEEVTESISPAEQAARIQLKENWLQSTVTQEVFQQISSEIAALENQARDLACSYHQHQNHQSIVASLVRADTLRKLIHKYGRTD